MKTYLSCICTLLLIASSARAEQSAAVLIPGVMENNDSTDGPFTIGFAFRVNSPIKMTAVGVVDSFNDGLIKPHQLALWTIGGTQLYSTTVPAGTSTLLIDRFRYVPVNGWDLTPNTDYVIAAANFGGGTDHYLSTSPVPQSSNRITLFKSRTLYTPSGALAFPTTLEPPPRPAYFGANFRFVAIPEPASLVLGMIAGAIVGYCRTRH